MIKGTTFGTIHSGTDLHLIQQKVEVQPAPPKTNYKDIPGFDGSKDLTEALGVGVKFGDREISWTFGLYPGDSWPEKQRQVSNALNGYAGHITLDDDPGYYYDGRLTVSEYSIDKLLRQIVVKALCRPYKLKQQITTVSRNDLSANYKNITLINGRKPVVPSITVSVETTLKWGEDTYTVNAGTHKIMDIVLSPGNNILKAKVTGESGEITVSYQEGDL